MSNELFRPTDANLVMAQLLLQLSASHLVDLVQRDGIPSSASKAYGCLRVACDLLDGDLKKIDDETMDCLAEEGEGEQAG